jgi:Uma2 family endonuclease
MSSAEKFTPRYTVDDYLQWQGDWELWDGTAVSMSPAPPPRHQQISSELLFRIKQAIKTQSSCQKCKALMETDWRVSNGTVVRPDVLVTCDPLPEAHIQRAPTFVAEVLSPSTADKDRNAKKRLYENNAVSHYLILDPKDESATLFQLQNNQFVERKLSDRTEFAFTENCILKIDLCDIFAS